jgi:HEAT repeat protein
LRDNEWFVRGSAAEALGEIGSPEAVAALINALSDNEEDVRVNAARALGKIGSPEAVAGLINALSNNEEDVRINAARALGEIGSPEAVAALINALSDNNWFVRESAAEALGKIGSQEAVAALINALSDNEKDVRKNAAEALESIINKSYITYQIKRIVNILKHKFWLKRTDEYLFVLKTAVDRLNSLTVLELPYSDLLSAGSPKARIISYMLNIVLSIVIIGVIIYLALNPSTPIAYFILAVFGVIGFIAALPTINEIVKKQFNKTRI